MLQVHFLAIWALEHHFPKLVTSSTLLKRFGSGKVVWMRCKSRAHLWKCDRSQKEVHFKFCTTSALPDDMGTERVLTKCHLCKNMNYLHSLKKQTPRLFICKF